LGNEFLVRAMVICVATHPQQMNNYTTSKLWGGGSPAGSIFCYKTSLVSTLLKLSIGTLRIDGPNVVESHGGAYKSHGRM
jgi:hypothetical protein